MTNAPLTARKTRRRLSARGDAARDSILPAPQEVDSKRTEALPLAADASGESPATTRRQEIIEEATALFAEKGYRGTSIRDIAARVGVLGGSLYHHIRSKEDLFLEAHGLALRSAGARIRKAVSARREPWDRLELACIEMAEILLHPTSVTTPLTQDLREVPAELRPRLIEHRDEFEKIFVELIADLPLSPGIDRNIFRLSLLTLMSNISGWYKYEILTPTELAQQIFRIFHHEPSAIGPNIKGRRRKTRAEMRQTKWTAAKRT